MTFLSVLHRDNVTEVLNGDYSKCGANYCPQYEVGNSNSSTTDANFEIADSKRYLLFSIYLVLAFLGALLIALTVDPLKRYEENWGQFHQPSGTKRKCVGSHSLAPVGAVQFHQQNYIQLYHYVQLENMLNFYPVCPALQISSA
jgi:hypothetical protein